MLKTGMQILKGRNATPEQLAEIFAMGHPPFEGENTEVACCRVTCTECWLSWLTTGKIPTPKQQ